MADKAASPLAIAATESSTPAKVDSPKKVAKAKNANPKSKPTHPSTADMVNTAIKTLAERNGSSLQAIKKYIASNYKLDTEKHALFIKKYLKSAVTAGTLVQTKGKGASGSFKLAVKKADASKPKPKAKTAVKKEASPKKAAAKKAPTKKAASPKAKAKKEVAPKKVTKKPVVAKKAAKPAAEKVAKPKSPSKAKKATKGPTAKPKAPKPKKATPKAKPAVKKAAAQKK